MNIHIVRVHPVQNGNPDLNTIGAEHKLVSKEQAEHFIKMFNQPETRGRKEFARAVYYGCVNNESEN